MPETDPHADPRYAQVREAFARLQTQDKAAFVLEATFDTVGQALHDVGQSVGDAIEALGREDFFDDLFRRRGPGGGADGPGAAEPPAGRSRKRTPPPTEEGDPSQA